MTDQKKIEQVKKILEHYFSDELGAGASDDIAKEISALYEPQEHQQVVCPKPCDDKPNCIDRLPHTKGNFCDINCDCHPEVGYCIPVPSKPEKKPAGTSDPEIGVGAHDDRQEPQPETPDELLTEKDINNPDETIEIPDNNPSKLYLFRLVKEMGLLDKQLAKCHQSEATEIDKLQKSIAESEVFKLHVKDEYEKQEARINELEHKLKTGCVDCESAIRADQNKKIGEEMMRHVRAESGLPPRWVADLIAKLQRGEF